MAAESAARARPGGARVLLALTLVILGTWLVWRGISRFSPPATRPVATSASVASSPAHVGIADLPTLEFDPKAVPLDALVRRVESATISSATRGGVSPRVAEDIGLSFATYFAAIGRGSFKDYQRFVQERGGRQDLDLDDPGQAARLRSFFESATKPYLGQRFSLDALAVRPRVLRGSNVAQSSPLGFRVVGEVTSATRFPQLAGVSSMTDYGHVITADTYEVIVPIEHVFEGERTIVWVGLWFTLGDGDSGWLPSKIVLYGPAVSDGRAGVLIPPPL